MARLAVMDATQTRRGERREESRAVTAEEREHSERISENYRRLLFDDAAALSSSVRGTSAEEATLERPVLRAEAYAPVLEEAPAAEIPALEPAYAPSPAHEFVHEASPSNTAQRLADYVAYPAGNKKILFEGLIYKNGELIDTRAPAAPAAEAVVAPVAPAPVPAPAEAEEDALPTRRTLDTLRRAESVRADKPQTRANALSALSLKTKIVLCAIAAAIVLAIVIVCVNTGLIGAANAAIAAKNARLEELTESYTQMQQDLDALRDPSNIDEWALEHGMIRP